MATTTLTRRAFDDLQTKYNREKSGRARDKKELGGTNGAKKAITTQGLGALSAGAARKLPVISDTKIQAGSALAGLAFGWWTDRPGLMHFSAGFGAPAIADQGEAAADWLFAKFMGAPEAEEGS
ncbi:MAG: hypothetical protein KDA24_24720 [Deltaproteobacteria bacterium]|nr:hypothetical protein [Deltaproteobacteria bacterium]